MGKSIFENLFVLDIANNHQGDIKHGINIIESAAEMAKKNSVKAAIKFQFRQLDTFIHKSHKKNSDNKHIPRFLSTELKPTDYQVLKDACVDKGMLTMCTPFDEESVDLIVDMGFDLIKIASCSANDWPLVQKIAESNIPVVCSTGGLTIDQVDALYSFFNHQGVEFAFMHCVSIYPAADDLLNLNQIDMFLKRYPECYIGWSTHEEQDNTSAIQIAYAKGAKLFERHIGISNDKYDLNQYSSTPAQLDKWMDAYNQARKMCGNYYRDKINKTEKEALNTLLRGVYAKKNLKKDAPLTRDSVYFAMPYEEGQLSSAEWNANIKSNVSVKIDEPIKVDSITKETDKPEMVIKHSIHKIKALLNEAGVPLNSDFEVEFSHHHGLENFNNIGAVLINCINRSYCKKIIVQLPGQHHPKHFHKTKEETFQVLFGTLEAEIDGHRKTLHPGDTYLIQPGVWHSFWTEKGVVFEEVSTRDIVGDSYYADKKINKMERSERKTIVDHWGRFQLFQN